MWWLRRSITTTSASACRSACAAASPAKPPPTITTRLRSGRGVSTTSASIALIGSPLFVLLVLSCLQQLPFGNSALKAPATGVLFEPRGFRSFGSMVIPTHHRVCADRCRRGRWERRIGSWISLQLCSGPALSRKRERDAGQVLHSHSPGNGNRRHLDDVHRPLADDMAAQY